MTRLEPSFCQEYPGKFSIFCETKQYLFQYHGGESDMLDVFKSDGLDEIPVGYWKD